MAGTAGQLPAPEERPRIDEANFVGRSFEEPVNFSGQIFTNYAMFASASFKKDANFRGAIFESRANFRGAQFCGYTDFEGAIFTQEVHFTEANFETAVNFTNATFKNGAFFVQAALRGPSHFVNAKFSGKADFKDAKFFRPALFLDANFHEEALFENAHFQEAVYFKKAIFDNSTIFIGAVFGEWANFIDAETKSLTMFNEARFLYQPPDFAGARLHEGTTWFDVKWPRAPETIKAAEYAVSAYERLKLEMDRLKKHEDELNFFALELQARRVLVGKWTSLTGWAIWAYGLLSDYGRSVSLPLFVLLVTTLAGADALWGRAGLGYARALGLSAASTLGVFNFRQAFFAAEDLIRLPGWVQLLSAGETIAGALLLFLVSLGLRNTFRLR